MEFVNVTLVFIYIIMRVPYIWCVSKDLTGEERIWKSILSFLCWDTLESVHLEKQKIHFLPDLIQLISCIYVKYLISSITSGSYHLCYLYGYLHPDLRRHLNMRSTFFSLWFCVISSNLEFWLLCSLFFL